MVVEMEQPARHTGFDRMQRVAGRAELELYQHRPHVKLDYVPDRGAPVESGMKSACRDPRSGTRRTNDGGNARRWRPKHGENAYGSFAPQSGGSNRLSVGHVDHQRDRAAVREEDMLDPVTRSREDCILIERERL
jgi:hypothetical protein